MSQNKNLQCSEKNEVIIINTKEETLDTKSLLPKTSSRVNGLAWVICNEIATENFIHCIDCCNTIRYLCAYLPAYQIHDFLN